ncbi:MAG: hypothetical protein M1830_010044 [Pleopsidium flavum]|nr:MAG: hypothetical protein M1830_010044 [Pleopsidium flavum]
MAGRRDSLSAQRRRRPSKQRDQVKRPQGIKKEGPRQFRRSARIARLQKSSEDRRPEQRHSSLSTEENHPPPLPLKGQKRPREVTDSANHIPTERPRKRLRPLPAVSQKAASGISAAQKSHISHWAENQKWPKEFLQKDDMPQLFVRKKSVPSLRRKSSGSSLSASTTASDQRPRDEKTAAYKNPSYETLLETQGAFYMNEHELGISDRSEALCRRLLEKKHAPPENTIFCDDQTFDEACRKLRGKNEARIIQDIARLLVPSAETLATRGDKRFNVLAESVNEGWNNSIPVTNPRPQPDYSAGFGRSAFSNSHFSKLQPALGDPMCMSYLMATYYLHFPFLTCEVKCGATGLDIADRQNGHSMTLAIRGIVELFKLAKRENELNREILTFSISHDHRTVRLYGYYPVINGSEATTHRHLIHAYDILPLEGKEKWTTYNFTVETYIESLTLLKNIRSVIDELSPDFILEQSRQSEPQSSEHSGLSQQFGNQILAQEPGEQDWGSSQGDLQPMTPDTSTQAAPKKKKTRP